MSHFVELEAACDENDPEDEEDLGDEDDGQMSFITNEEFGADDMAHREVDAALALEAASAVRRGFGDDGQRGAGSDSASGSESDEELPVLQGRRRLRRLGRQSPVSDMSDSMDESISGEWHASESGSNTRVRRVLDSDSDDSLADGPGPHRGRLLPMSGTEEEPEEEEEEEKEEDEEKTDGMECEESEHGGLWGPGRSRRNRQPSALMSASRAQSAGRLSRVARAEEKAARNAARLAATVARAEEKAARNVARLAATRVSRTAELLEDLRGRVMRIHTAYSCVHPSVVAAVAAVCGVCTTLTLPAVLEAAVMAARRDEDNVHWHGFRDAARTVLDDVVALVVCTRQYVYWNCGCALRRGANLSA